MSSQPLPEADPSGGPPRAVEALRHLVLGVLAGAVAGLLVGGVYGRFVMFVLARLNPQASGRLTDDGFEMGRFTLDGTVNLLMLGLVFGLIGGALWVFFRGLRFGPRWWRVVSMPLAALIIVGDALVHSDGVDFTLLDPPLVTIGLVLTVPALATVLVTALGDRWIGTTATFWRRVPWPLVWVVRAAVTVWVAASGLSLFQTVSEVL